MKNQIMAIQIDGFFDKDDAIVIHRNGKNKIYLNPTPASIKRVWNTDFTHLLVNPGGGRLFTYYHLSL